MIPPSQPCANVLIVDDEELVLRDLCLLLGDEGHRCTVATTARQAMALCEQERFDCMVLDLKLGTTSGLALAERLSRTPSARPTHIVLMSGYPREDYLDALRSGLVDAYLQKPASPRLLQELIAQSLRPKYSASA